MTGRMYLPQLVLPWPARPLWPNAKAHWRVLAAHRARQRHDVRALAMEAGLHKLNVPEQPIGVSLTFCAPSRRSFDIDNALAAMKGALDALAATIRIDDRWFEPTLRRGGPCKDGAVIVVMEILPEEGGFDRSNWQHIGQLAERLKEETRARRQPGTGQTQSQ